MDQVLVLQIVKDAWPIVVGGGLVKFLWDWYNGRRSSRLQKDVNWDLPKIPDNHAIYADNDQGGLLCGRKDEHGKDEI